MASELELLKGLKEWQDNEIIMANERSWARRYAEEQRFYRQLEERKERILARCRMIGALVVDKGLPAGDPCWVAQLIGTYI
jgi:hypothetical protein